jgi:hypothetical protein
MTIRLDLSFLSGDLRSIIVNSEEIKSFSIDRSADVDYTITTNRTTSTVADQHDPKTIITLDYKKESLEDFIGIKSNDTAATFTSTMFGTFTANFKALPPPIPGEYLLALFGLTVSFVIPSILHWINGWKQRRNLDRYIKKLYSKDNKILNQDDVEKEISELYIKGKISESHVQMLKDMLARAHEDQLNLQRSHYFLHTIILSLFLGYDFLLDQSHPSHRPERPSVQ